MIGSSVSPHVSISLPSFLTSSVYKLRTLIAAQGYTYQSVRLQYNYVVVVVVVVEVEVYASIYLVKVEWWQGGH